MSTLAEPVKMSLYVVSACNLACRQCIMHGLMHAAPRYQMQLDELAEMLRTAEASGYRFHFVLTGGEPLMWSNLQAGLQLLRSSPVTASIVMFTNAGFPDRLTVPIAEMLDSIRVSEYFYNMRQIEALKNMHADKVQVVERTGFWVNPTEPLPVSVAFPVDCLNEEVLLYDHHVYACPHNLSIAMNLEVNPKMCVPSTQLSFLDELQQIKHSEEHQMQICRACVSNACVRRNVEKTMNISGNRTELPGLPPRAIPYYAAPRHLTVPQELVQLSLPTE